MPVYEVEIVGVQPGRAGERSLLPWLGGGGLVAVSIAYLYLESTQGNGFYSRAIPGAGSERLVLAVFAAFFGLGVWILFRSGTGDRAAVASRFRVDEGGVHFVYSDARARSSGRTRSSGS